MVDSEVEVARGFVATAEDLGFVADLAVPASFGVDAVFGRPVDGATGMISIAGTGTGACPTLAEGFVGLEIGTAGPMSGSLTESAAFAEDSSAGWFIRGSNSANEGVAVEGFTTAGVEPGPIGAGTP